MTPLYLTLLLVALQRAVELALARKNTVRLRRLGAIEADSAGYPLFVLLHAGWLASLAAVVPPATPPNWGMLAIYALLQLGRVSVILSLGGYWTTRILTLPGAPLVRSGLFRYFRHPNYLLVIAEIAVLPLAFGAIAIAAAFSALNLALIARRIRIEDDLLAPRRAGALYPIKSRSCSLLAGRRW
jgi:methyltransferase